MRDDIAGANIIAPVRIAYSSCLSDPGFHPTVRNLPVWCKPAFWKGCLVICRAGEGKPACASLGPINLKTGTFEREGLMFALT